MKRLLLTVALVATSLSGCNRPSPQGVAPHGRYVGIGLYSPNALWSKLLAPGQPVGSASAKLADDEQIIVVVDSLTGEVRQCGNFTGYCVAMNPWTKPLTAAQNAPLSLAAHATEVAR